ncbi:hypothetical protein SLEP1_g50673 [Rubroshorea leprosula]|uniref:DUF4216 domain-containing protein n=1 Tax=Rubroshorea leprosula TaxID=152421 RepID=A0AAV5M0V9_9ROSI|nr:hypothetical protein SLEP1_g50673 [Rubroshorea leprosula]
MINVLGLGYKKIDICVNDCFLYYDEQSKNLTACPVCGESRYEPRNMSAIRQKDVPRKSLWYLPITPRLQRLYMSRKTAKHMTWHLKCREDADEVIHPAGSKAWKHFDETYPTFADEPRNVRLGLCTDGFNPFGCSATPYSCWPVFLTVYNLPSELCMKSEHIFLAMIIAGPKSPGKNIDVMLRPLIDELKELWTNGVETYDSYGMLSGWSTHGKLSCPYCMENTKAFQLQYGRKTSFFDCHRQCLPPKHPFRRDKNFYLNRVEKSHPPPSLDGTLMEEMVNQLPGIVFGQPLRKHSIAGFGVFHNWVKRSIFWELPYWKDLLIRHNLDVMHCEKNFLDNIKNTVMDDKGCMKDNTNARLDLQLYCNRSELELIPQDDGTAIKPNASYELRLFGMKSHDCHVFMQRLLPIAFRDFLIDECEWYDINKGIVVHPTSGIVDINPRFKLQTDEPFILASQAQQVFYARYPSQNPCRKGWFASCKIRARAIIDTSSLSDGGNVYYQDDDPPMPQLEQPTVTQPPLADDQFTGDDATMEEDTEECNLEAELDAEYAVLDLELDAQLEEELSRAVSKIGRGMDKGDDAPADPSQRKVLSLNRRGTFSHERFGRTAIVIWKYLYDEPVLFWSSWPEEKKRVAWENFQNDAHQKYVEKHGPNKDSWPKWDPLIWKEVVGPPKKGQMKGMSTLQDPVKHGIPWRWYDMSDASFSTTRILTSQVQQLQFELTQVREEMAERVQTEVAARIHTEVSQRVSEMEANFERRFQEHMRLLSQQYSMNATQPQTGYPSSTPPQIADPSFEGFRLDHFPPHS